MRVFILLLSIRYNVYTCHVFLLAADLCSYLVVAAAAVLLLAAGVRHR